MKQIVRQLDILRKLQARRYGASARELADEYKVDRRTIQRDLGDLREAGFILNEKRRADQRIYYQLAGAAASWPRRTTGEEAPPALPVGAACSGAGGLSRPRLVVGLHFRSNHRRAGGEDADNDG